MVQCIEKEIDTHQQHPCSHHRCIHLGRDTISLQKSASAQRYQARGLDVQNKLPTMTWLFEKCIASHPQKSSKPWDLWKISAIALDGDVARSCPRSIAAQTPKTKAKRPPSKHPKNSFALRRKVRVCRCHTQTRDVAHKQKRATRSPRLGRHLGTSSFTGFLFSCVTQTSFHTSHATPYIRARVDLVTLVFAETRTKATKHTVIYACIPRCVFMGRLKAFLPTR